MWRHGNKTDMGSVCSACSASNIFICIMGQTSFKSVVNGHHFAKIFPDSFFADIQGHVIQVISARLAIFSTGNKRSTYTRDLWSESSSFIRVIPTHVFASHVWSKWQLDYHPVKHSCHPYGLLVQTLVMIHD